MNESKICFACQKEITDDKTMIGSLYRPVYCIAVRESVKKEEGGISKYEDNLYHHRCYKEKNWNETDKLVEKELINLGNKRY